MRTFSSVEDVEVLFLLVVLEEGAEVKVVIVVAVVAIVVVFQKSDVGGRLGRWRVTEKRAEVTEVDERSRWSLLVRPPASKRGKGAGSRCSLARSCLLSSCCRQ